MSKISVIIPALHEPFLQHTIDDLNAKAHNEHDLEIIVVLDGYWPNPSLTNYTNVIVIHETERKGMRHSINSAARVATGKYLLKIDAHCLFAEGFDKQLRKDCKPDYTVVPVRYSLDTVKWLRKKDKKYEFEYISSEDLKGKRWPEFAERVKGQKIVDLMTTQGSFEKWGGLDEVNYGGMGREAQEVCLKTWLSGGRFVLSRNTWYAHWSKGKKDIKYTNKKERQKSTDFAVDLWMNDKWPLATRKLQWLVEKFAPVPGWDKVNWQTRHENYDSMKQGFERAPHYDGQGNRLPTLKEEKELKEGKLHDVSVKLSTKGEEVYLDEVTITPLAYQVDPKLYIGLNYNLIVAGKGMQIDGMNRLGLYKLFAKLGYKVGCEVGVQRGRNAIVMVDNIPDLKLYLVDPYKDYDLGNRLYGPKHHAKVRGMTHRRMQGKDVVFLEKFSEDAVREVPDDSLDFVYIDGMHTYDFAMLDLILWSRKIREGGIVSGHDYIKNRNVVQVMHAVDDYVGRHKIPLYLTDPKACVAAGDKSTSFFFVKPSKRALIGRIMDCSSGRSVRR